MFGRSALLPHVGPLRRGWGKWYGRLPVRGFDAPLELWIEVPRRELLEPFAAQAGLFANQFDRLQADVAGELFAAYEFYRRADLQAATGFRAADYGRYPPVTSAADVWHVLRPYRLRLGPLISRYLGNSYLLMDVDWPNPHYFQVFMEASASGFRYMHTELVG
jgi:hypothetical protein